MPRSENRGFSWSRLGGECTALRCHFRATDLKLCRSFIAGALLGMVRHRCHLHGWYYRIMAIYVKRASSVRIVVPCHHRYRLESAGRRRGRFRCIMMSNCIFTHYLPCVLIPSPASRPAPCHRPASACARSTPPANCARVACARSMRLLDGVAPAMMSSGRSGPRFTSANN